ncbi:putative membrane protein Rv0364 [Deinococcus xinjiangensis]|uniref:Membrane protein Rv0364 n=1 Tax=Deinococcus xinjiangensis TaxID=457454 RepID=A0ABP9VCM5_9DEIO
MQHLIDVILGFSYIGIFLVVFAETGLLVGAALPGDSLLITAGIVAANKTGKVQLDLGGVILAVIAGAILGSLCGYFLGKRFGPSIFSRQNSRFFKPEYRLEAEKFFAKEGPKSVMLARFIPFVRAVVPTLAGVSNMNFGMFALYSVLGAILWGAGLTALAYYVGQKIPNLDHYILLIIGVVLVVSFIPVALKLLEARRGRGA